MGELLKFFQIKEINMSARLRAIMSNNVITYAAPSAPADRTRN
jgi:hypothetical protein